MSQDQTILIVDDDQLHLTLYTWILEGQGYKCKTALVTYTSVDLSTDAKPDLVLLDYRLSSSLSASDVVRLLRDAFSSVPIIVLSEMQWMPDDMRGQAMDFVNKGDPKRLLESIAAILQG